MPGRLTPGRTAYQLAHIALSREPTGKTGRANYGFHRSHKIYLSIGQAGNALPCPPRAAWQVLPGSQVTVRPPTPPTEKGPGEPPWVGM